MSEKHAGADWIKKVFGVEMSPHGEAVANLLGDLFMGIYHLNLTSLKKVDWANPVYIEFVLDRSIATFDFNELTRLVILCHDRHIRGEIEGAAPKYLRLIFHPRQRQGRIGERHPTIEQAVEEFRRAYPLEERILNDVSQD